MKKGVIYLLALLLIAGIPAVGAAKERDTLLPDQTMQEKNVSSQDTSSEKNKTGKTSLASDKPGKDTDTSSKNAKKKQEDTKSEYKNKQKIGLDSSWKYAKYAKITSGYAVVYKAKENRKNIMIGVNAGHGTKGGESVKTLCHPDGSPKVTGGTTAKGATKAIAVSSGMQFRDGTSESTVTLRMAKILKEKLLEEGYDVLMLRTKKDVQLDNIARTVICNNVADCHIALHWDSDGLSYDKGCFAISVPDGVKKMEPVASHWKDHEALAEVLVKGLKKQKVKICGNGLTQLDLTQMSYSTIPSVDMELGNQSSDHSDKTLENLADGLVKGINRFFR